jgi:hypothetical protein
MEQNVLMERLMNKYDKNRHVVLLITYFFLICDDIIIFLKYYIFLVGASFVGKERLHSEPEIF